MPPPPHTPDDGRGGGDPAGPGLFDSVPERELRQAGRARRFARGEIVFHADDPGDSAHLVTSGRFAARVTTELGESATLAIYGVRTVFGLLSVLRPDLRRTATVVALEPAETLQVSAVVFRQLHEAYPQLREATEQLLVDQLAATNQRLVEALYLPVQQRVRRRLTELAGIYGTPGATEVVIPLTQEDLADLAGTTRETVNRVLRAEEEAGRVSLGRRQVTVRRTPPKPSGPVSPGPRPGR